MELLAFPLLALLTVLVFTREVIAPASRNLYDRRWLILASCMAGSTALVSLLGGWWFARKIEQYALFHAGDYMPSVLVGFCSFMLASFFFYWWHRATHHFDFLWRVFHQLHHSAPRVEALTSFFAHPLDSAAAVLLSTSFSYLLLGADPIAAGTALVLAGVVDLFLHSDIRTPRWVGYVLQRPEMHTVHHAYGHHAQNYGLPLWDWLFGTWSNPAERVTRLGFDEDKANRIHDMLLLRDVHQSPR